MFKRVMVAVVGLPLLILILGWAPSWATMLLLAAMCAIGAWELMRAAAGERGKPLTPLTVIAAAAVPVCVYGEMSIENTELTALPVLPFAALLGAVFIFAIFALAIHRYDEEQGIPFAAVTCAIFAGLAFPLMFSCLLRLRMMPAIGMLQVFLPLAISFGSDTFALFAGMLCGKHKLAPIVSPHKTVEGAIGGIFGSVLAGVVLTLVYSFLSASHNVITIQVQPRHYAILVVMGAIASVLGILGDLFASSVKRQVGIKDYGTIFPGHGGILDRFDSVMFIAPFVSIAVRYFFYVL